MSAKNKQKRETTAERAIDGLAMALFLPLITTMMIALFWLDPRLALISLCVPPIYYVITVIVSPLRNSKPLHDAAIQAELSDPGIQLRVSDTTATCALDLGRRNYIIFNKQDVTGYYQDWRGLIGHEHAHLRYRDARYFHFAGIFGGIAFTVMVIPISAFYLELIFFPAGREALLEGTGYLSVFLLPLFVGTTAFFLFWIRQSLHRREFRADKEGLGTDPDAFRDWLRRERRREKQNKLRWSDLKTSHGRQKWRPSALFVRSLRQITHPSFEKRQLAADDPVLATRQNVLFEALRSFGFIYGGGMLAAMSFETLESASSFWPLPGWTFFVAFAVALLPAPAACGAISVPVMRAFDTDRPIDAVKYLGLLGALNWLFIAVVMWVLQITGIQDVITRDLPPPPTEITSSGIGTVAAYFLNFTLSLIGLNMLLRSFVHKMRFNPLMHILIGAISFVGAFLLLKLEYWALFG